MRVATAVDPHGGELSIESQPGDTVVRVRLPVVHRTDPWG